ncbi:MAG TPA: diaminopimelate decarboxylase [Anaerolineales bacterium]|nr:diaminopimelate decarboxylase [Anaerolineales bacterium]
MTDQFTGTPGSLFEQRLPLFPLTTTLAAHPSGATLSIAGQPLDQLAERFGTPLYLYDQSTLDAAVATYSQALQQHYPAPGGLTYAGKAFLCTALAQWACRRGLKLDCTGVGEITIARSGGASPSEIVVHGVNKSQADLKLALASAGVLVVDNLVELARLVELAGKADNPLPELWLRLRPGRLVETHAHIQTGQSDSKFGLDFSEAARAVSICLEARLPLTGLHFHLGSQFHDVTPLVQSIEAVLDFSVAMRNEYGWLPRVFSPGGGWGVAYHESELPQPPTQAYIRQVAESLVAGCTRRSVPLPRLQLEPGRSLVARAGVALYRLGAVKSTPHRRWLLLDGGLADNPRPALYGARYSALPVSNPERPAGSPAWLAGPYCESGDVLIEALPLPNMEPGELVAVPVSGAYQLSMSSNYNGACRPAVVWLAEGQAHLVMARETNADLTRRDLPLPDLRA